MNAQTSSANLNLRVGLLGFGEVGKRFGADLRERGVQSVAAFDIDESAQMREHAQQHGISLKKSAAELVADSDLIICGVTAAQTTIAAQSALSPAISGKWYLDVNSAAPATKAACFELLSAAGGKYVESAVMTSVPPYGIKVPMLLGGPHAAALQEILAKWGCDAQTASSEIGIASAIKMCRSVIIKGLESLVVESFTTARAFGVEERVLASLRETFPQLDWEKQGDYLFSRMIQHGKRRAEEMLASAETVASRGIEGTMAAAAAKRQAYVAEKRAKGAFEDPMKLKPWRERADEILRTVKK